MQVSESFHADVHARPDLIEWLRRRADDFHNGDVGECVDQILRSVMERDLYLKAQNWEPNTAPVDPWENLTAKLGRQRYPLPRKPE